MANEPTEDVEALLASLREGDDGARERLLELLYGELRRLASGFMRREGAGHTLQPTALVHEAWMRLSADRADWQGRVQFFGAAAEAMRRILVDRARRRAAQKRGGGRARVTFQDLAVESQDEALDLLALDEALEALTRVDSRLGELVKLRYFAGLGVEETAKVLGVSRATLVRDWTYARAWLHARLDGDDSRG